MSGNTTQSSQAGAQGSAKEPIRPAKGSSVTAFLLKLVKATKGAQFYPRNHPAFSVLLARCHAAVGPLLSSHGALVFEAKNHEIHFDGKPVTPELPELRSFAMECLYRRIRKFQIDEGVSAQELEGFIRAFVTGPDVIQTAGGIEKLLFGCGVRKISVNEVNYQDLLYGDLPEEHGDELFAPEEDSGEEGAPEEDPLSIPEDATPLQEQLVKLLIDIDSVSDASAYGERAAALVSLINTAEPPFGTEDAYRSLRVLTEHATGREGYDPSILPHALWAIREIASPEAIDFLIERFMATRTAIAPKLLNLLCQIGSAAIPHLIDHLASAKSIHARRILSTAISSFGDAAVPLLLNALNDQRWHVIRNAVAILGEIGDPDTITSLEPLASNREPRIAREALRAVGRIRSPESRRILERFLVHAKGELQLLAAFALGVLRDLAAVPVLASMLPRRVIFTNIALQREVIKALAKIGSPSAVPALGRLFRRRTLFAREKNELLRVSAAQALARLDTEEARSLLATGLGSANETVARICRTALDAETMA